MTGEATPADAHADFARVVAGGVVAGGVVHEVANLLTVIDGLRQLRATGGAGDDFRLLDAPAKRCQELVESYRQVLGRRRHEASVAGDELRAVARLLEVHLRGRRTVVFVAGAADTRLEAPLARYGVLAFLCGVLAVLERSRIAGQDAERVDLRAGSGARGAPAMEALCRGVGGEGGAEGAGAAVRGGAPDGPQQLEDAGRRLAHEASLEFDVAAAEDGFAVRVRLFDDGRRGA